MPLFPAPTSAAFLVLVVPCGSNRSGFFQLGEDVSISRRTSTMVRTLGVASAAAALTLGVAGSAFACVPSDFSASAACNATDGTATVTVTDTDGSAGLLRLTDNAVTPATVTVEDIPGPPNATPQLVTFTGVPWKDLDSVVVEVKVTNADAIPNWTKIGSGDSAGKVDHSGDCSKPTQSPTPSPSQTTDSPKPTPTDTATTAAPTTAAPTDTSTVDATATASPTGAVLATTGGGSDSGMIAGIAGAFVVVGAGAVFFLRRRSAGSHS
jgi:hypothetical protein